MRGQLSLTVSSTPTSSGASFVERGFRGRDLKVKFCHEAPHKINFVISNWSSSTSINARAKNVDYKELFVLVMLGCAGPEHSSPYVTEVLLCRMS